MSTLVTITKAITKVTNTKAITKVTTTKDGTCMCLTMWPKAEEATVAWW